jgi:hypothetical protein
MCQAVVSNFYPIEDIDIFDIPKPVAALTLSTFDEQMPQPGCFHRPEREP